MTNRKLARSNSRHNSLNTIRHGAIQQRRVFITGAGRGLGLEFVRQYLLNGDTVYAGVRRPLQSPGLDDLTSQYPTRLTVVRLDVTKASSLDAAFGRVAASASGLDVLINNAGINAMSRDIDDPSAAVRLGDLTPEALTTMFQVNAFGALLVTQSARPLIKHGNQPRLINISSWKGSMTNPATARDFGYSASKAALNMITRKLAVALDEDGIIVTGVDPGWVSTDMGGPHAKLTPTQSVHHMLKLIQGLTPEHSGRFFRYDGVEQPW